MKDYIQDIKTIDKAIPVSRIGFVLVMSMIAVEIVRQLFFPDKQISGMAVTFICALLSIVSVTYLTSRVGGQRYVLISTLPVRMKNVPRIIFRLFEATVFTGFAACVALSFIFGKTNEALVLLMVGAIFNLIGYALLLLNAAPEFSSGAATGARAIGTMAVYFVVGMTSGVFSIMSMEDEIPFNPVIYFIALGIFLAANLVVRHFAFKKYINIVRNIKKEGK